MCNDFNLTLCIQCVSGTRGNFINNVYILQYNVFGNVWAKISNKCPDNSSLEAQVCQMMSREEESLNKETLPRKIQTFRSQFKLGKEDQNRSRFLR
ncbi:hypothetical protein NPIL_537511 [Nephila pilipes]|uniref:Uncharacterized protein n=1 Tax=Nephila pilipes TaxID=299642 RepID=A0A8X6MVU5_NEPPI|nr:hypothetical protein NPIL_537511 [Nephila pilipes]